MKRLLVITIIMLLLVPGSVVLSQDSIAELKEKIIDLQNQGRLGFRNFALCTNIIGYGQYVEAPSDQVKAGTEIYFYYEPENLFTNRRGGSYHMWFTQDMIVLTETGEELYNGAELLNFNYQTTSPVLDVFAKNSLDLGTLPPGKYVFKAVMHDKLKNVDAEFSYTFKVVP
jgi:hypothetical protein